MLSYTGGAASGLCIRTPANKDGLRTAAAVRRNLFAGKCVCIKSIFNGSHFGHAG